MARGFVQNIWFGMALLLCLGTGANADELLPPNQVQALKQSAISGTQQEAHHKRIQGSWKRVGYWLWDKKNNEYMEVASRKDRIDETVESWQLRSNKRFRHIMSETLFFTGKWQVDITLGQGRAAQPVARTVILVVDVSGTMRGEPIQLARKGALALVNRMSPNDRLGMILVGSKVTSFAPDSNHHVVKSRLQKLVAKDKKTQLLDGVWAALDMAIRNKSANTSVVVLSDGKDEGSSKDLLSCLDQAEKLKVPIHSVGYSRVEQKYLSTLKALSRASGGQYLPATAPGTLEKALGTAFESAMPMPMPKSGAYFVLHTTQVRGSVPSMRRPHDYFVGTYIDQGRNLVLFYIGTKFDVSNGGLHQGHVFERVKYGER